MFTAKDYEVVTDHEGQVSIRRSDGASIPADPRNRDYYEFTEIEAQDTENLIKRTTLPKPEPVTSEIDTLKAQVSALQAELNTVKTDLSTAGKNLSTVQTELSTVKTDLATAKTVISTLKTASDVKTG